MANLLQGAPLPTIQTTQTNVTTAPDWYSSFLSSLPTQGQQAAQQGGVAPMTPEQLQAINLAGTVGTAGAPHLWLDAARAVEQVRPCDRGLTVGFVGF